MGGTSTDVSHYDGSYERAFETEVAGVRMRAPMMLIHTVAAGGGSILHFDGARFRVGTPPEIVAKLNAELRKIIDNPEIKAKIATLGFEAFSSSSADLNEHVKVQLVKWTKMIKEAGIEPE